MRRKKIVSGDCLPLDGEGGDDFKRIVAALAFSGSRRPRNAAVDDGARSGSRASTRMARLRCTYSSERPGDVSQ